MPETGPNSSPTQSAEFDSWKYASKELADTFRADHLEDATDSEVENASMTVYNNNKAESDYRRLNEMHEDTNFWTDVKVQILKQRNFRQSNDSFETDLADAPVAVPEGLITGYDGNHLRITLKQLNALNSLLDEGYSLRYDGSTKTPKIFISGPDGADIKAGLPATATESHNGVHLTPGYDWVDHIMRRIGYDKHMRTMTIGGTLEDGTIIK